VRLHVSELDGRDPKRHWKTSKPITALRSWLAIKAGTSPGAIPAKVLIGARAIVTGGVANDSDAVNHYAAAITKATETGTDSGRASSVRL